MNTVAEPTVQLNSFPPSEGAPVGFQQDASANISSSVSAFVVRCVAAAIVVTGATIVIGIFGVTPDGTGFLQGPDPRLGRFVHVATWHPTDASRVLTAPLAVGFAAFIAILLLWSTDRRRNRATIECLTVTISSGLAAGLAGLTVRRPSPGHLGDLAAKNIASFPSMPVAMATGLAVALIKSAPTGRDRRCSVVAPAVCITGLIAIHLMTATSWPLDEAAGVAIGLTIGRAGHRQTRRSRVVTRRPHSVTKVLGAVLVLMLLFFPGRSYAQILTAPGNATLDERTVEWLRDSGFGRLVDRAESWWLWRHLPSPTKTISALPQPPVVGLSATSTTDLPGPVSGVVLPALPGEGRWTVAAAAPNHDVQIATTYFRPDPDHPSLVAAVAWINMSSTRVTLIAGTRQPGGGPGPAGGHVPLTALDSLIAAFNSGYKMKDTPGGALIEGRTTGTMVNGLATLAIDGEGRATIGEWGTDLTDSGQFTGLRQNLHLMVSDGAVVDGVATNAGGKWGTVRNALPTWRSGLGVTATGDMVYLAGDNLTLGVLAAALVEAGAVNAMELDIHPGMVAFNLFTHEPAVTGHKLLPNMPRSANRYLATDWRDFIMVTER